MAEEVVLMKGNEAIAHAAIRIGVDGYFGYPITPQSEVLETLAEQKPWETTGMVVLQAESEVAAINMVYGGAGSGKMVMTSSSSPGVSLKQEGISYIGESCFKECKELVKVSLPSELSVISKELFCECEKLQEINIPQNLISVEDKGFYRCSRLKIAALPETIENIGNNAFYACHNLGIEENDYQLILPKNLQTIGESAFEKSGGYRYVFIPASVKKIEKYAFKEMGTYECEIVIERGCSAELPLGVFYQLYLQKLSIPDSVTKIGGIFIAKDTVYSSKFVKDEYGRQVYDEYGKEVIKVNTSEDYMEEFSEELIICCEPGSAAMDFAREKNIQCEKYEN